MGGVRPEIVAVSANSASIASYAERAARAFLAKRLASSHSALTTSVHAERHAKHWWRPQQYQPMTGRSPNRTVLTAVAALLLSMPAAGTSAAIARDAPAPASPPVIDVAVIPETPRPRRVRRYAAAPSIRSLLVRRLYDTRICPVSRTLHLGPQPSAKAWHARGPPNAPTRS